MRVVIDLAQYQNKGQKWVVALGNFDGVHKGHQVVITKAKELAGKLGCKVAVVTFEPHPQQLFHPDGEPFRLTPPKVKRLFIEKLGVDTLFEIEFTQEFAQMEAYDFVKDILVEKLNIAGVVTGYNFHFGHNRQGTPELMARLAEEFSFKFECLGACKGDDGEVWSSSKVRELLGQGQVKKAGYILGHPFVLEGEVIHGRALGRTIGFPTANVLPLEYLRPMHGVYAVKAKICGEDIWRDAIANIGNRPTVSGVRVLIEVHLLDWSGDLYGQRLQTALLDFVRPEQKFENIDELKEQIQKDVAITKNILEQYAINKLDEKRAVK